MIITISFVGFLLLFVAIGVASVRFSRRTRKDYYLASLGVPPWLVGLSAVATNNSGYMFIGVMGYTYTTGLAAIWLMIGWVAGDFLASLFVHKRLRLATAACNEASYAGVLSHWGGFRHKNLQRLMALISLVFLLAYASAQLVAGGKALHALFHWPAWGGAVMGAVMVMVYCMAGGIRASIWTDAAQSLVMIVAMGLLLIVGTQSLGGLTAAVTKMQAVHGFLDLFPSGLVLPGAAGAVLFVTGWLFAGLSVIGQPHIMVRFMTLQDPAGMARARVWYYGWYLVFYAMATGVGMLARVYLSDPGSFDAELALPVMALELLPPVLVGLVLAGIFAATMSTADSLILSCSAALTHDLLPHRVEKIRLLKGATVLVTALALLWALTNSQSVFNLVIMAWSGLASAFAPLLLVLALGHRLEQRTAITMMIAGIATALCWRWLGWQSAVYEGLPGILAGLSVFILFEKILPAGEATPEAVVEE